MKNVMFNVLKGLLVVVLFIGGSIALSTTGVKTVSEASAAVKGADVIAYLHAEGYVVVSLSPIQGSENWLAHTILKGRKFLTTVYVEGTHVVSHEDVSL